MPPRISVFPKCYFDEIVDGRMPFEAWIRDAASLGGEGIEHYDGFFRSLGPEDVDPIARSAGGDGADHFHDLLLAGLHARGRRRAASVRWNGRRRRSI